MKIKRVTPIYFSATGNTLQIISSVIEGLDIENIRKFNLTIPDIREEFTDIHFEKEEILLVGTPVYTGEIPDFLIPKLKKLSGNGQPAVPITVNGEVEKGIALEQLKQILEEAGFETIAAASFVGEHSYSKEDYKIGHGRPNEEDISEAKDFGAELSDKLESLEGLEDLKNIELDLEKGFYSKIREKIPISQYEIKKIIQKPEVNREECLSCGACANNCPMGAIDEDTLEIDDKKCIRCMGCVNNCPNDARKKEYKYPGLVRTLFEFLKNDEPLEPIIYNPAEK